MFGCRLPDEAWKLRGQVGYLGHEPLLYRDLSGRENLRFHARLHGIDRPGAEARIDELLDAVGMQRAAPTGGLQSFRPGCASASPSAVASCMSRRCCCSMSPSPTLTVEGRELARALIGPGEGRTRVLVTHDPERTLPDADRALLLGHGGHAVRECAAADLDLSDARLASAGATR